MVTVTIQGYILEFFDEQHRILAGLLLHCLKIGKCHFVFSWIILGTKSICHIILALDGSWSQGGVPGISMFHQRLGEFPQAQFLVSYKGTHGVKELFDILYYTPFSSIIRNELQGLIIIGVRFAKEFSKEKRISRKLFGNLWVSLS